jgi:Winged helix DNA-binding domain
MLDTMQIDELLVAVKNLSNQMAALRLALPQGATPSLMAFANDRDDDTILRDTADGVSLEQSERPRDQLIRAVRPPLPDPRLVRRIIWQRQHRDRFFDSELLCDPVWDMLLDLAVAAAEFRQISVTSLCIASRVPPTTALRWIGVMTDQGLVRRVEDSQDRRRSFIALTDKAMNAVARYFEALGTGAKVLV